MKKYFNIIYILIPFLSVLICRILKLAQGEKNEEIVFGIMAGIILNLILSFIMLIRNK
ncbi:hypothetical protein [Anaerofustis sp. NSJ-163]|uniref:hypothetical protein n=1 Tax=Anaerofustis sp. NSJ-163 TaxID=2944391 RepID=UPI00209C3126|nr:hypothetical protein [Anaerofustis sp. NSJ-163]MCO8193742.1 hypothetical protein [Anaerofustis sp. NSJ-163]